MPVTEEIAAILDTCDFTRRDSFVRQLQQRARPRGAAPLKADAEPTSTLGRMFRIIRAEVGIHRKLTPHDFRRTTAVKVYTLTRDARDVQALLGHRSLSSTIWYLDHDLHPVDRTMLELVKLPAPERKHA